MAESALDDRIESTGTNAYLQAVDLEGSEDASRGQRPLLKFDGDTPPQQPEGQADVVQIEGTELHGRPRVLSRGGFKEWTSHQLKITKQLVSEKLGNGTRTVDSSLETRIESLRDTQRKYSHLIGLATQFKTHFTQVVEIQKALAEQFAFLSVRTTELHNEFSSNSDAQKSLARSGEGLLLAIKHFLSSFHTMCSKTMEDTLQTVKLYEAARLNYDAYRAELEALTKQVQTNPAIAPRVELATAEFEKYKSRFEQLRHDLDIKLKLLDENKLKVVHNQMALLLKAFAAYYDGSHTALEAVLTDFRAKQTSFHARESPSWLEQLPGAHN